MLEPLEPPAQLPEASVLGPTPLVATPELTIPLDAHTLRQLGFDPDELDVDGTPLGRYYALRERLLQHQGLQLQRRAIPPDHRLLGHPTTIEYDVLADAAARGLEPTPLPASSSPTVAQRRPAAAPLPRACRGARRG